VQPPGRVTAALSWRPLSSLDYKYPDGQDRRQSSQAADRPARRVNLAIRSRPVHQRIVPVSHNGLLEVGRRFHSRPVRQRIHLAGNGVPAVRTSLSALMRT
jgi:hypothetical protein